MAVSMKLITQYLDLSQADPPLRSMPSIRVSHIVAHTRIDPRRIDSQQVATDFGIPRDAVFAALSYYLKCRQEINRAIENRNTAYQDELGNA